jgi:UDP-2-acetamido-2-deoxy-ribo-hexuluronate aminotransferase
MVETQIPFTDLKAQYAAYKPEIDSAITRVVESCQFIQGDEVRSLEHELSEYAGVAHCVTCSSGTDALLLALMALGVGPGDEVITTPFTFFATAESITLVGATPVFVDIDPVTYNMDPACIEAAISDRTRVLLPVGLFGQPAEMDVINDLALRHGLEVIEDAAQSFGAKYAGRFSGTLGKIGCTSFFPAKPLGCFGDGGAVFTDDDELSVRLRQLMNHGQVARYQHGRIGLNGRMDAIQAAVLRVKLVHYDNELAARRRVAMRYTRLFSASTAITTPMIAPGRTSIFAQYSILIDDRDELVKTLAIQGIPTAIYYPMPVYTQPPYRLEQVPVRIVPSDGCVVAEQTCGHIISLPFGPFLKEDDQDRIIDAVIRFTEEIE